jgi:hypothetical protein
MYNLGYLRQIDVNITDLCNKTCSFCPRHSKDVYPNNNENISIELFTKIIDECNEQGFEGDIMLCGRSEPTMHPQYEEIFDLLTQDGKTWNACITTNGYKLEKYWDRYYNKLDGMILNTYTTRRDYEDRVQKYGYDLKSNHKRFGVEQYFKPDGQTVQEINSSANRFQIPDGPGRWYKHDFNSRCGIQEHSEKADTRWRKLPCSHTLDLLFLNFDGKIHMCCNDWGPGGGKGQTEVGEYVTKNIFYAYRKNKKRAEITHHLLNGRRNMMEACTNCTMTTDSQEHCKSAKEDWQLQNYMAKLIQSKDEYYHDEDSLKVIPWGDEK